MPKNYLYGAAALVVGFYWWNQRQLKQGNTLADNLINTALSIGQKMKTSASGIEAITQREGERLYVYKDSGGLETIGVGHLLTAFEKYPNGITKAQSRALLVSDLSSAENAVNALVKVPLTQARFDALVSFVFNVGANTFKKSSVLTNTNAQNFAQAARSLALYNKVKINGVLVANAGLTTRRASEINQFA
jgi:lysozyme